MRILVACEFSGTVRDAFIKEGHDAMSCDLEPTDIPGPHYQGDVMDVINENWDFMIAHPPCTYLSNAGARFLFPNGILNEERLQKGLEAKKFFMLLFNANISKIVVENPVPSKIYGLPPYNQIIEPYEFGHPFKKKTCLWLKNVPPLMATFMETKPQSTKIPGNWFNKGGKDRQKNRAKTFQGIADAMAEQWGNL